MSHARVNPPPFNGLTKYYPPHLTFADETRPFSVNREQLQRIQCRLDGFTQDAVIEDLVGGAPDLIHAPSDPPAPDTGATWLSREGTAMSATYTWTEVVGAIETAWTTAISLFNGVKQGGEDFWIQVEISGTTYIAFDDASELGLPFSSIRGDVGGDDAVSFGTANFDDGTGTLFPVPLWINLSAFDFAHVTNYYTIDFLTFLPTVYITS